MPGSDLVRVKPSIIFATWFVREIGLMSFPTDLGGICLGRGGGAQLRVSEKEVQRLHTKRYYTYQQSVARVQKRTFEYYIRYAIWSYTRYAIWFCTEILHWYARVNHLPHDYGHFFIDCDVFNAFIRYLHLTTLWSHPWNTVKRRATSWNP